MEQQPEILTEERNQDTPLEVDKAKLFTFQDMEGKEQSVKIKIITKLAQDLIAKDPSVVGLTVTGSTVQGYSLDGSDIDINIVVDSSEGTQNNFGSRGNQRLSDLFMEEVTIFSKTVGTSFDILECKNIGTLNEKNLLENPSSEVGILIYPFFGDEKKKADLILKVKDILKHLDYLEIEAWINDFAAGMIGGDLPEKKFKRLGIPQTSTNRLEYIEQRQAKYKQKIREMFID